MFYKRGCFVHLNLLQKLGGSKMSNNSDDGNNDVI